MTVEVGGAWWSTAEPEFFSRDFDVISIGNRTHIHSGKDGVLIRKDWIAFPIGLPPVETVDNIPPIILLVDGFNSYDGYKTWIKYLKRHGISADVGRIPPDMRVTDIIDVLTKISRPLAERVMMQTMEIMGDVARTSPSQPHRYRAFDILDGHLVRPEIELASPASVGVAPGPLDPLILEPDTCGDALLTSVGPACVALELPGERHARITPGVIRGYGKAGLAVIVPHLPADPLTAFLARNRISGDATLPCVFLHHPDGVPNDVPIDDLVPRHPPLTCDLPEHATPDIWLTTVDHDVVGWRDATDADPPFIVRLPCGGWAGVHAAGNSSGIMIEATIGSRADTIATLIERLHRRLRTHERIVIAHADRNICSSLRILMPHPVETRSTLPLQRSVLMPPPLSLIIRHFDEIGLPVPNVRFRL